MPATIVSRIDDNLKAKGYVYCYIPVRFVGYNNIPNYIEGTGQISYNENGFNGKMNIKSTEYLVEEQDLKNAIVYFGLCKQNGSYISSDDSFYFNIDNFDIRECIQLYEDILGFKSVDRCCY